MKEMVCIVCPRGCRLTVDNQGDEIKVDGNFCKRGQDFAISELTKPMRTICTTVKTQFEEFPVLPVRVSAEIPKENIFDVMKEINKVVVKDKLERGDIVIKNILGLNVDVIATSDILKNA
ncbi:MAG: DUF1667 domain-containing protein [Clostridia bacterium]|nr:DUF1667 domain-containing protein [Clostridia bacterium]